MPFRFPGRGALLAMLGAALILTARMAAPQAPERVGTPVPNERKALPTHTPTPASPYGKGLLVVPTPTSTPAPQPAKAPPHSREVVIGFTGSTPAQSREVRIDFVGKPVSPGRVPRS